MDIVKRFLSYTQINTTTVPKAGVLPSCPNQRILAELVGEHLRTIGLKEVQVRENAIVTAVLEKNTQTSSPTLAFFAHLDTASDYSGDTHGTVIPYKGGDVVLNEKKGVVLRISEYPELENYKGDDLIVTDGTSLLGADNKSGIAEIVDAMQFLVEHPDIKHGDVKVAFVPDEEQGLLGAKAFDVKGFADLAYTLDCGEIGEIVTENWNAAEVVLTFKGVSAHPINAKGNLKNSIVYAHQFMSLLPPGEKPEYTEKKEGYFWVKKIEGTTALTTVEILIREFSKEAFHRRKEFLFETTRYFNKMLGGEWVTCKIEDTYLNVADHLQGKNRLPLTLAIEAMKNLGITPKPISMRGGYDGNALSDKGLPCVNLFCGGHNFHSIYEYIPVSSMKKSRDMVVEIVRLFAEKS